MTPIKDLWVAATPASNNEGSVFYDWGQYPGRSVPGWIGACMPWCIYCPVMWPIMCKYHLSREQPYVQGLSCGQPEQVSNVNNEFSRVTAVSVGTRGIWLCSGKQQGEGIRKDTFLCARWGQGELKSLGNSWTPSSLQQVLHSFQCCFVPLQKTPPNPTGCSFPSWAEGRSTVLLALGACSACLQVLSNDGFATSALSIAF